MLPRALTVFSLYFLLNYRTILWLLISERVQRTSVDISENIQDTRIPGGFFDDSLALFLKVTFLCQTLPCLQRGLLFSWFSVNSFFFARLCPLLGFFLMQILFIIFSGCKRLKAAWKISKMHEDQKVQAGTIKTKLRTAFDQIEISPIRNGSLETREYTIKFKFIWGLEWHSSAKRLNSVVVFNESAFSITFKLSLSKFSNYGEFFFFARARDYQLH